MEFSAYQDKLVIRLLKKVNNKFEITVNGDPKQLPLELNFDEFDIQVNQRGGSVVFSATFNMTVNWDGNNKGEVILCDSYANHVCGLCGNANGKKFHFKKTSF